MKRLHVVLTSLLSVLALAAGCAPVVGDACENQTDCGRQMYCELAMPGGYCTQRDCLARACPEGGVCVQFSADVSYCMQACDGNGDCRSGYACVTDFGPWPFCNDKRGEPPTVD